MEGIQNSAEQCLPSRASGLVRSFQLKGPYRTLGITDLLETSVRAAHASCLNAFITADELHDCIKRLKRNKSPGIDGVLSEIIKDGGDVLHDCLCVIFNLMLANHFSKQLSVGLITAVYKSERQG